MPRVGARIIKSSIAVFFCFLIDCFRNGIPFYSAIAAILCMRPELSNTISAAKSRIIATLIGGGAGILFTLFEHEVYIFTPLMFRYFILSVMIIPLIYISLLMKQPASAYLSCVVFLCITVSHMGDENYILFGIDRMLDTLIGVGIAYAVNSIRIPGRKLEDGLILHIDPLLREGKLDTYARVQIQKLQHRVPNLTLYSDLWCTTLIDAADIDFSLPLIPLHGSVLYRQDNEQFYHPCYVDEEIVERIVNLMQESGHNCFLYELNHDHIITHHGNIQNDYEQAYYQKHHRKSHHHFYHHEQINPAYHRILEIRILDQEDVIEEVKKELIHLDGLQILCEKNGIRMFSKQASLSYQIDEIKQKYQLRDVHVFTNSAKDSHGYMKELKVYCRKLLKK